MCFWTAEPTPWRQQGQPISLYFKFDVECGKYPGRPCGLFTYQRLSAGAQSESTLIYRFQASIFLCCLWLYLHLKYSFNTARRSFPAQVICSILSKICLCRRPSVSPGMCSRLICPSVIQCHFTSMTDWSATVSVGCIMGSTPGGLCTLCMCMSACYFSSVLPAILFDSLWGIHACCTIYMHLEAYTYTIVSSGCRLMWLNTLG